MIRVLAIDDEPLALRLLEVYISKTPGISLLASCTSTREALPWLEQADALLIDINMPDLSGMEFVRSLENPPLVVFTTAYSEYAVEGFRVNAVDYLL
ncbi:MAG: response regulator, partial [Bacteroidales bacterium]|nr:response regulator [Bacteroidales bacterium]